MKSVDECPDCGSTMVLRTNRKTLTLEQFWGCSHYPSCTGTRPYDSAMTAPDDQPDLPSTRAHQRDARRWERE